MAPKRRRSERGPISLAVRALLELPDTIVAEILRLLNTGQYLVHKPPSRYLEGANYARTYLPWSGTQRMVNRRRLLGRYITDLVPWSNEITDLGFLTYDAPRTENNRSGLRIQGQGMMNVPARFRSPF